MTEESTGIAVRVSPERVDELRRKRRVSLIGQFQKLDPPKFKGEEGPEAAEDFISDLEKIFGVLGCASEEKLLMAEYSLQRGAENWWKASRDGAMISHSGDVWTVFRKAFLGKYFPHTFREDRALEFAQLVQGRMTVDEYEGKFAALSRYGLPMDAEGKAKKFELGLDPSIRLQVAPFLLSSYEDIYRRAQNIEKALVAVREKEEAESSRRMTGGGFPPRKRFRTERYQPAPRSIVARPPRPPMQSRSYTYGGRQGSQSSGPPLCPRCRRPHFGFVCPSSELICYQCGRPGHMMRNCPHGGVTSGSGMSGSSMTRPRGGARSVPAASMSRGRSYLELSLIAVGGSRIAQNCLPGAPKWTFSTFS